MCRFMYTVLMATVLLFAAGGARAEPPAPAQSDAALSAPEQPLVLHRLSSIDSELDAERQAQDRYKIVPPIVVASLGALPLAGGLVTLAFGGLLSLVMSDDGPGGPKPIELPWVRNSLYVIGAGAVVAAGGLAWLFYRLNHRRVHTRRIRELEQQRKLLTSSPVLARATRSAVEVAVMPLLSPHVQGALLALRF